jgi:hypothetical protein
MSFPHLNLLSSLETGSKATFISSSKASATDFHEIPFPNGKGQVRKRVVGLLCDLCVLCGESIKETWSETTEILVYRLSHSIKFLSWI